MNWELIGIGGYIVVMLMVGLFVAKKIKTDDDYFLAGRSLGPVLATFSIFATWFGAETCIGSSGSVYRNGLSSIHADPMGYTICLFLMGIVFSKTLWNRKITTIPDLYRERFSPGTERLAALIMIPSSLIWSGAQIRAFGQIIISATAFSPTMAIAIAAGVVLVYTMCGGMLADAYNDLIQGIAVIAGLIMLFVVIVMDMGGVDNFIANVDAAKLSLVGGDFTELTFMGKLELWMVPIFGSLMAQELVSRVISSRSSSVAFNSCMRAGVIYFLVGSIPVLIGLVGTHYFPNLQDSETIMPLLAKTHLNYWMYIVFVGALVAAILSTVDTTLLSASALASHNLILPMLGSTSEKKKVIIARAGVFISGAIAFAIAFLSESITGLVETASAMGGPSILVITTIALFVKRGNAKNALFAMGTSIVVWAMGHFVIEVEYPVILTVFACAGSYFLSLPFTKTSSHESVLIPGKAEPLTGEAELS